VFRRKQGVSAPGYRGSKLIQPTRELDDKEDILDLRAIYWRGGELLGGGALRLRKENGKECHTEKSKQIGGRKETRWIWRTYDEGKIGVGDGERRGKTLLFVLKNKGWLYSHRGFAKGSR